MWCYYNWNQSRKRFFKRSNDHSLNAIYEHKCLVIKNQDFSHKGYKKFGSEWGILIKHMLEYLRAPSFPELMVIGNTEKKDEDDAIQKWCCSLA